MLGVDELLGWLVLGVKCWVLMKCLLGVGCWMLGVDDLLDDRSWRV